MTRYEQGFITKCAEYGVDGQALLAAMSKEAAKSPIPTGQNLWDLASYLKKLPASKQGFRGYFAQKKAPGSIDAAVRRITGGGKGRDKAMEYLRFLGLGPEVSYTTGVPRTVFKAPAKPAPVKVLS